VDFLSIILTRDHGNGSVNQLATDLPRYQTTLGEKIHHVREVGGTSSLLKNASGLLSNLSKELEKPQIEKAVPPPALTPSANGKAYPGRGAPTATWCVRDTGRRASALSHAVHHNRNCIAVRDLFFCFSGRICEIGSSSLRTVGISNGRGLKRRLENAPQLATL
jgi:hypothetical protein